MQIEPSETAFAERYGRGQAQVVWTTLVADLETPVSAFLKLGGGKPMSFLLESVEGGDDTRPPFHHWRRSRLDLAHQWRARHWCARSSRDRRQ